MTSGAGHPQEPPHAVVIEDERDILDLLQGHLRRLGFSVAAAQTGERGLDLALTERPDVVLVDVMLPGIDGREVIRRLRADPRTQRCLVVVCSVLDSTDLADIDADAVLVKPFGRSSVAQAMASIRRQEEQ